MHRGLIIDDYKLARGCSECGYNEHACALDLHHTDPSTKLRNLGHMKNGGWALETIAAELEKCIVLCANCHRVHTHAKGE